MFEEHSRLVDAFVADFSRIAEGFRRAGIPYLDLKAKRLGLTLATRMRLGDAWELGLSDGWVLLAKPGGSFRAFRERETRVISLSPLEAAVRVFNFPPPKGTQPKESHSYLFQDGTGPLMITRHDVWDATRTIDSADHALANLVRAR